MENIDGFSVERDGDEIIISFYNILGMGDSYVLPLEDARQVYEALQDCLGP